MTIKDKREFNETDEIVISKEKVGYCKQLYSKEI